MRENRQFLPRHRYQLDNIALGFVVRYISDYIAFIETSTCELVPKNMAFLGEGGWGQVGYRPVTSLTPIPGEIRLASIMRSPVAIFCKSANEVSCGLPSLAPGRRKWALKEPLMRGPHPLRRARETGWLRGHAGGCRGRSSGRPWQRVPRGCPAPRFFPALQPGSVQHGG